MRAPLSFESPDFLDRIRLSGTAAGANPGKLSASPQGPREHYLTFAGPFVRPISLVWLGKAAAVSHTAALVGVVLWYLAGLRHGATVPLTHRSLALLGLDRHASKRALPALERAGLIAVERHVGRAHLVTIRTDTLPTPANRTVKRAPAQRDHWLRHRRPDGNHPPRSVRTRAQGERP